MLKKLTIRLPMEWVERLEAEAKREKTFLANVLRDKISGAKDLQADSSDKVSKDTLLLEKIDQQLTDLQANHPRTQPSSPQENPLLIETLFVVRELLFERNAQALRRIDEKIDRLFGKDRIKIL